MTVPPLNELLEVASDLAVVAGRRTLAYFNAGVDVEVKSDDTPVTRADREAEQFIREQIAARYPKHGLFGEEYGEVARRDSDVRWIIDPIDGTKSFIHGVPIYATLIGVEIAGRVSVGAIYLPALDELVCAGDGLGCWWNGRRAKASSLAKLAEATVCYSDAAMAYDRSPAFERITRQSRLQRNWGDAYGYALVATGRADVMMDPVMNPWDCAPMLPVLREAGGRCTDWRGNETIHGGDLLATNGLLHEAVLGTIREAEGERR